MKTHPHSGKKNGIDEMRGMSEPFPFGFSITESGDRRTVTCHCVIFNSFEMFGESERKIDLSAIEKDPRFHSFRSFLWENCFKEHVARMNAQLEELWKIVDKDMAKVNAISRKLDEFKSQEDKENA